ncbi:MAG: hypothetical protein P9X24_07745 [Candidatus Hatepunaea meridiana]|nr:hypothetical protein [Candidatus Hatepunaea meridiana]
MSVNKLPFNENEQQLFHRFNEQFTELHWKILEFFDNPKDWYRKESRQPFRFSSPFWSTLGSVLEHAFPELKSEKSAYQKIWADLYAEKLVNVPVLVTMQSDDLLIKQTSNLGTASLNLRRVWNKCA